MLYNILFSPTGGTGKVASILANALSPESTIADLCDPSFQSAALTTEDTALISLPSYGGRIPCTAADRLARVQGNGAKAILVCVYGGRAYDNTLAEMQDLAQKSGFQIVAAVAALAEHSIARKVCAGRPDAEDAKVLNAMAVQIKEKLDSNNRSPVQVPGTAPEAPASNFGGKMAPMVMDSCSGCGTCAAQCPTQAIDSATLVADKGKCIGCMRCVAVCPSGVRRMNGVVKSLGGIALSVLCSQHKENELFL